MADNFETMLRNQVQANLTHALDTAVQAGDIKAARAASEQLNQMRLKSAPAFTNEDIKEKLKQKAPWFGKDPRKSAKVVEFGKNMDPSSFTSAEEFADALCKAVDEEFKSPRDPDEDEEEEEENEEEEKEEPVKTARKKTDAPVSNGARAVPRKSGGSWTKLSDAPKDVAVEIKRAADKFTRNATKEQRDKYISTALGVAYASAQRSKK